MDSKLSNSHVQQVGHIARLAMLAMCARGVSAVEFDASPEIQEVFIRVSRSELVELPVEICFVGEHDMPMGGLSI